MRNLRLVDSSSSATNDEHDPAEPLGVTLPLSPLALRAARVALEDALPQLRGDVLHDAQLLVCEVIANSVNILRQRTGPG